VTSTLHLRILLPNSEQSKKKLSEQNKRSLLLKLLKSSKESHAAFSITLMNLKVSHRQDQLKDMAKSSKYKDLSRRGYSRQFEKLE
jgi:hypothetical protein